MALPENGPQSGAPDPFEAIMRNSFGESQSFLAAQLRGYKGPKAEEVFGWRQRGLGVEVGTQIAAMSGQDSADQNLGQNRMLFIAMRLPESITQGRRMRVAVFLTDYHYSAVVIEAKKSPSSIQNEEWASNVDFDAIFQSQDDPDSPPSIVPAIVTNRREESSITFHRSMELWPFEVSKSVNLRPDYLVEEAVKYEEELKRQRELAAKEVVLADGLRDVFASTLFAKLGAPEPIADIPHYTADEMDTMFGFEDEGFADTARLMEKRLPGPMGDQIEELDKQGGIVRIIAGLQPDKNGAINRVMCAAIRLDLGSDEPRHALVFTKVNPDDPGRLEDSFDVRIVRPKTAGPHTHGRDRAAIASAREDYSMMLTPLNQQSPAPYEATEWVTSPTESALQSFERNLPDLPFELDTSDRRTPHQVVEDAINNAQMLKMLREY